METLTVDFRLIRYCQLRLSLGGVIGVGKFARRYCGIAPPSATFMGPLGGMNPALGREKSAGHLIRIEFVTCPDL